MILFLFNDRLRFDMHINENWKLFFSINSSIFLFYRHLTFFYCFSHGIHNLSVIHNMYKPFLSNSWEDVIYSFTAWWPLPYNSIGRDKNDKYFLMQWVFLTCELHGWFLLSLWFWIEVPIISRHLGSVLRC